MKLTQEIVVDLLDYDKDTGVFVWKIRPEKYCSKTSLCKTWNTQRAGSVAGGLSSVTRAGKTYKNICILGRQYLQHRIAWLYVTGHHPKNQIDHIDGDSTNNIFTNLREVTPSENKRNSRLSSINTSGASGVYWEKKNKNWRARIRVDGALKHVGVFKTFEEAKAARKDAERKYGYHENHGSVRPL